MMEREKKLVVTPRVILGGGRKLIGSGGATDLSGNTAIGSSRHCRTGD